MAKFLTPGFEREFLQKINGNILDKKICHDCLSKEISEWLNLYPAVKKKILSKINSYVAEVKDNTLPEVCSACKKENIALCPYCFSEGIFNLLKKNKMDVMVIMDYLSTFNFDSKHEGLVKNAMSGELLVNLK